jgi:hypothetical protein
MTKRQLAIKNVLEAQTYESKHMFVAIHNEMVSKLTGIPNWLKESNGLDLVGSLKNYENNFINSFDN